MAQLQIIQWAKQGILVRAYYTSLSRLQLFMARIFNASEEQSWNFQLIPPDARDH